MLKDTGYIVITGDMLRVLSQLPDASIDAVVTDPPYGIQFMGKEWDHGVPSAAMWRACLRVLRPGGHLLSFGGTRTYHRLVTNVEDAGFEIRDMIAWIYGSGFPKHATATLKPALEPIVMARKPLSEKSLKTNVAKYGTGGLNTEGGRVPVDEVGGASPGRFPANLIHDGSDEVLAAFPRARGQLAAVKYSGGENKTSNVYGAMNRGSEPSANSANKGAVGFKMKQGARRLDTGSAARFFYCAKASKNDRTEGGTVDNRHPTVKPTELMRYLCRLVTPTGGIILDPFCGSGSTGKAAILEGFRFIGIDRDPATCGVSRQRLDIVSSRVEKR